MDRSISPSRSEAWGEEREDMPNMKHWFRPGINLRAEWSDHKWLVLNSVLNQMCPQDACDHILLAVWMQMRPGPHVKNHLLSSHLWPAKIRSMSHFFVPLGWFVCGYRHNIHTNHYITIFSFLWVKSFLKIRAPFTLSHARTQWQQSHLWTHWVET